MSVYFACFLCASCYYAIESREDAKLHKTYNKQMIDGYLLWTIRLLDIARAKIKIPNTKTCCDLCNQKDLIGSTFHAII